MDVAPHLIEEIAQNCDEPTSCMWCLTFFDPFLCLIIGSTTKTACAPSDRDIIPQRSENLARLGSSVVGVESQAGDLMSNSSRRQRPDGGSLGFSLIWP
jgi:hypothetical protein